MSLYILTIILACMAAIVLLRVFVPQTQESVIPPSSGKTYWVQAIFLGFFLGAVFADPLAITHKNLYPCGFALIFFTLVWTNIFLDKRTWLRGIMTLVSLTLLVVFFCALPIFK